MKLFEKWFSSPNQARAAIVAGVIVAIATIIAAIIAKPSSDKQKQGSDINNLHEQPNITTCNDCSIYLNANTPVTPDNSGIRLNSLNIQLWAEYDKPSVLVIYDAVPSKIPVQLKFRIPADTGIINAIGEGDGNTITEVKFESERVDNWIIISFEVTKPNIHFEYYDTALIKQNGRRLFTFLWTGDYAVDSISFAIQQPSNAKEMVFSPLISNGQTTTDGLFYFAANSGYKPKGNILPLTFTYFKETDELTSKGLGVQPIPKP